MTTHPLTAMLGKSFRPTPILVIALAMGLVACAGPKAPVASPDDVQTEHARPLEAGAYVVIASRPPPADLAQAQQQLETELGLALRQAGIKAAKLEPANHAAVWAMIVEEIGGLYDPVTGLPLPQAQSKATQAFARHVCAETQCDLLLMPQIVHRMAVLEGRQMSWDGVRMPITDGGPQTVEYTYHGKTWGWSLQAVALNADGQLAFQRTIGVSPVFTLNSHPRTPSVRQAPANAAISQAAQRMVQSIAASQPSASPAPR